MADKKLSFSVQYIDYDDTGIAALVIQDQKGNVCFEWKKRGFNAHKGDKE